MSVPNDATTVTEPRDVCRVAARSTEPLGRKALLTSLTLRAIGDRVAAAWIVPPLYLHGGDDLAAASISFFDYGNPDAGLAMRSSISQVVLDAEEPSTARGLARSPTNLYRVFALPGAAARSITTATDQLSRDDDGNELVESGDFSAQSATVDAGSDDVVARNIVRGAPFYTRTAFDVTQPFVLGLRTADVGAQPSDEAKFFAVRGRAAPANRTRDFWSLPIPAAEVRRARNPAAALREHVPEGLEIAETTAGYAIAFRFRGRIFFGWLSRDLQARGPLVPLTTLGGEPGKPRLAARGDEAVLLLADRPNADAGPAKYRLVATRARYGEAPGPFARVETGSDGAFDEFAPSIADAGDDRWLILWSYGPLEANAASDRQDIFARPFSSALEPTGASLTINQQSGSDPRAARTSRAGDVVVVWGDGRGLQRSILSAGVRCERASR
ncbi:MAG: hypothetical protein JNK05_03925 [Myxococcales bacterium]|nr:hypothetical protein [Myxococcales bacterium]